MTTTDTTASASRPTVRCGNAWAIVAATTSIITERRPGTLAMTADGDLHFFPDDGAESPEARDIVARLPADQSILAARLREATMYRIRSELCAPA